LSALINAAYRQPWTGFNDALSEQQFAGLKTLWDWLQLLIIPLAIAAVGLLFNRAERATDRYIATQDRHERVLQAYLDKMADHLLAKDSSLASPDLGPIVRNVARARTLTVLRALEDDVERKTSVIRFLYEAQLIGKGNEIVVLRNADLSGVPMDNLNLSQISLQEANLSNANLLFADLSGANLLRADLSGADLRGAKLSGADLRGAKLSGADLTRADLTRADLRKADLSDARVFAADLTGAKLAGATVEKASFTGAEGLTLEMIWETMLWKRAWFNQDFWLQLDQGPKKVGPASTGTSGTGQSQPVSDPKKHA
jgi:hypothetical protein